MNAEIKAKWLEALRSGKYEQGICYLQNNGRFCCLGVLCDLMEPDGWQKREDESRIVLHDGQQDFPALSIMERVGLLDIEAHALIDLNDGNESFTEIADYIETNL